MHLELMRDPSRDFPVIDDPGRYSSAKVWHCKYKSLAGLAVLWNLRSLEIATFPDETLDAIRDLKYIYHLKIVHFPKIRSLNPLHKLTCLEQLDLRTLPSWDISKKKTIVDSYHPLAGLPVLQEVTLYSVVPADGDLRVLSGCPMLKQVHIGNDFPVDQVAGLKGLRPDVEGRMLQPVWTFADLACNKCGAKMVVLCGAVKYATKCPECHGKAVAKHIALWEDARSRASAGCVDRKTGKAET